ncbi:hypothetical protein RCL_jg4786.t1 [Rhizophagus clarus]|uniref:Uncharacterized protein n=1 Tax=Rhizophagus clarus TaxID=94130 RepID=A0A8H3MCU0_9GLOM|nr:hypothetical protein RCL_jg4786.t1 [Rhizophagus clarus]
MDINKMEIIEVILMDEESKSICSIIEERLREIQENIEKDERNVNLKVYNERDEFIKEIKENFRAQKSHNIHESRNCYK